MDAEDLDEYDERFQEAFSSLEKKIYILDEADESEKETIIRQAENLISEIKQDINTYTAEIEILDYSEAKIHRENCKIHEAMLDNLEGKFETAKMKARNIGGELAEMNQLDDNELQDRALKLGDKIFAQSKKRAVGILNMIKDSNDLVNDINKDIHEQNQKLMDMEDIIKESQSHLKRAAALINYFEKAFAKDICMKIMIILIALCIIGVIVFAVLGKGNTETDEAVTIAATTATSLLTKHVNCQTQQQSGGAT